jgi:ABC-type Fe3+ transport system permease subunit
VAALDAPKRESSRAIAGLGNLAKFALLNLAVALLVIVAVLAAVRSAGEPPTAVKIVLTLMSVSAAGVLMYRWLRRRRSGTYGGRLIGVSIPMQSAWDRLDVIADWLNVIGIPLSRHMLLAAVGAGAWSKLTLVAWPLAFVLLLAILFIVFPLEDEGA